MRADAVSVTPAVTRSALESEERGLCNSGVVFLSMIHASDDC